MEIKIGTKVKHFGQCGISYGMGTVVDSYEHEYENKLHQQTTWRVKVKFDNGVEKTFLQDLLSQPQDKLPRLEIVK